MALDHRDKIPLGVSAKRRLAEMWVVREIALRRVGFEIGEVASASAGDEDFRARLIAMLEKQHATASIPCRHRAHQTGRSSADDRNGEGFYWRGHSGNVYRGSFERRSLLAHSGLDGRHAGAGVTDCRAA